MGNDSSPYAPPQSTVALDNADSYEVLPANNWPRFFNLVIDYIGFIILSAIIGIAIALIWGEAGLRYIEGTNDMLVGLPIYLGYYIILEHFTGRTLGKLITGTRVVNELGERASFGQIIGRSFSRFIPFEALSFFGTTGRGWHDSFPNTYVIKTR